MRTRLIVFIGFGLTLFSPALEPAGAQDHHYWSQQYGTRSSLMSGAVVGGARDTSAGYYNPGALGFVRDKSLSVSANALQFEQTERKDAVAEGIDLDSDGVRAVPLLVSGVHIFESQPDIVVGYSLLTKSSTGFNGTAREELLGDLVVAPGFEGAEDNILQASQKSDLVEYWGGLSLATKVSDTVSVGFTNFLALREQEESRRASLRQVNRDQFSVATSDVFDSYDYWNLRALWKIGAAADWDPVRVGLTVTTPSVSVTGDGEVFRDLTITNGDIDGDGSLESLVANDRQDSLDAEFRSPLSVAAGIEFDVSSSTVLGASVEWFDSVGGYSVVDPDSRDFLRPAGVFAPGLFDSQQFLRIVDGADTVLNFAVGVEQKIDDMWTGYVSFRSDYENTKLVETEGKQIGFTNWDIWHVTAGIVHSGERSDLGVGLTYSFGDSDDSPGIIDDADKIKTDYEALAIMLGYTYHFDEVVAPS